MGNFTISRMTVIFGFVVTLGLICAAGIQNYALHRLEIKGPIYNDIVDEKDLIADALPPSIYLVEVYMLATEGSYHEEKWDSNLSRIAQIRKTYAERISHWTSSDRDDATRNALIADVKTSADAVWSVIDEHYIPASGRDADTKMAAMDKLMEVFYAHRDHVEKLVDYSNKHLSRTESDAQVTGDWLNATALFAGGFSVLLFIAGTIFLRQRAISPISRMTGVMGRMASGELDLDVPYSARGDEIGLMAKALSIFRDAGLENRRLQEEAEEASRQRAADRAVREAEKAAQAAELVAVVDRLGAGLQRLADCNIQMTIDEPFAEQFERMRADFNNSIAAFQDTLQEVLNNTFQLNANSTEMRQASDNMAKRTEQQAAALEQTSAALEQITATVKQSSERTQETRKLVRSARDAAVSSNSVVRDAIGAMNAIEKASGEISQIIGVIDEIAFQTNLLALNAGVEAARAGDAGKGFAVVAQEVRELAQRSASAAKEIKGLIVNSGAAVQSGVKLVGETGQALTRIEEFVTAIDGNVDAIATGVMEQSTGLAEISNAVNTIDQMTQQNAAMAEETTSLSHVLSEGAAHLAQLVQRFKLNRRSAIRDSNRQGGPHMRQATDGASRRVA